MKLEDQACSLELAKKLKELGVVQDSLWYWEEYRDDWMDLRATPKLVQGYHTDKEQRDGNAVESSTYYSAFTVAELGEMLKDGMVKSYHPGGSGGELAWCSIYFVGEGRGIAGDATVSQHGATEAEARAKILIYLIENQLVGVKSFG